VSKSDFIGLRVDPSTSKKLDEVAALYHIGKSTVIRELLANCDRIYPILKKGQDTTQLEKRVHDSIKDRIPNELDPVMVTMIGEMLNRVMTQVAEELVKDKKY